MVINAWTFDEDGELKDRLIDVEDLKLFGVIQEDEERHSNTAHRLFYMGIRIGRMGRNYDSLKGETNEYGTGCKSLER